MACVRAHAVNKRCLPVLICGPIEQSMHAANVLVTRWPRVTRRRSP
jgi:hypothetical protein